MKKLLSLLLVVILTVSVGFAAIAEEPDYKAIYADRVQYVVDNVAAWAAENGMSDYLKPYDEETTITMVHSYSSRMEEMMEKLGQRYGETWDNNRWTDVIRKSLNLNVKYNWWSSEGNDYNTKLRLSMSSETLPDIFVVNEQTDVAQLAEAEKIIPLNDLIEKYAMPEIIDRWYMDDGMTISMVTIDGNIYGYPQTLSHTDNAAYIFIRQDWMKELDIKEPQNIQDVWAICKKFVDAGKAQYGVYMEAGDNSAMDYLRGMFEAYYAYPETWVVNEDGTLQFGATKPEMKAALKQLQALYADGLIDPEFATKDTKKEYELVINGKIGVVFGPHWTMTDVMSMYELEPTVTWYCCAIRDESGNVVPEAIKASNRGFVCINKDCKNPEAAFKMINLFHYASYYSNDPTWWGYEDSYSRMIAPVWSTVKPTDNLDTYANLQESFAANDESLLQGKAVAYYGNITSSDYKKAWSWNQMFGTAEYTPMKVLQKLSEDGMLFYNAYVGAPSITYQDYWSSLNDLTNQMIIKVIMGADVDTTFDEYVTQWNKLGGKTITKEANEWYQAQQAAK